MEFSPKQVAVIEALADGISATQAAETVGVGLRTVMTWKKNPAFMEAVGKAVAIRFEGHRSDVRLMLGEAIDAVRVGLKDDGAASLAARILTAPHLAAFAGGAAPGATRVEHEGIPPAEHGPREVRITLVEPKTAKEEAE